MCGRYQFDEVEAPSLAAIMAEAQRRSGSAVRSGEVFPTNRMPILTANDTEVSAELGVWGFPHFKGSGVIINARAETVPSKRMFASCLDAKRCVIPSSGFFEWDKRKQKHKFNLPDDPELYMAGLYNNFQGERRYVILTTQANPSVSPIHHRMPLVLLPEQIETWVLDASQVDVLLTSTPPMLVRSIE